MEKKNSFVIALHEAMSTLPTAVEARRLIGSSQWEMIMPHASKIHGRWIAFPVLRKALSALVKPLVWLARRRQRRELMGVLGLPDYVLKDIGLQRHEITQEAFKPFWRD
jgi:uncharacterized protein YjiS (DUF1127 family)